MLRKLVVPALVILGACKDDAASTVGEPSAAVSNADLAADNPTTTPAERKAKPGSGLVGAVKEVMGSAKASPETLLIPRGATVVVGLDLTAFVEHPLFESLRARLGRREREQLQAAIRCGIGPDKWRAFVVGVDPTSRDMAMVVKAVGLGTKTTLQCLVKEIGTFTLSEDGKTMSDHTGGGIVLHDDAIAFATPAWMSSLQDRIDGKGTAAVDGPLNTIVARTDQTKPLWFAGLIPMRQQAMAHGLLGSEPSDVAGSLSMSESVGLTLTITVPDPKAAQAQLQQQWNTLKGLATANGVPEAVAKSVEIGEANGTVTVELNASNADIEDVLTKFFPSRG